MILEIKNTYEGIKEKAIQSLSDKLSKEKLECISEKKQEYLEHIEYIWKYLLPSYNELLKKSKTYEQSVKSQQDTILKQMSLSTADHYYQTLERDHKKEIEELKFKSNQLVKQFIYHNLSDFGQIPKESETILELKNIIGGFKEKIDNHLTDNNIHNKIKSDVFKLFRSKLDQQIDQLKQIEKNVKETEERLITSNDLKVFKSTQGSLRTYQQQIDKWKLESDKLTEEMTNKAIEFSYQMPHLQQFNNKLNQNQDLFKEVFETNNNAEDDNSFKINNTTHSIFLNQQPLINPIENDLSINSFVLGGDSRLLEIKNLLSTFKEKLNASLDENSNIHQKIKFDVCKIYKSRCEQHLENLKLIEKSVAKYENLPNSQKTEKNINHLALRYKQIDKWKIDSDNLIEKITVQALELSYKIQPNLNEQNNLQVQKLSDQVTELTKIIDKMSQNPMGMPPINQLHPDKSDTFEMLNLSQPIKSVSSFEDVEGFLENNDKKEKELKKSQWKGEVKGEIKLIKMGIKNHMEDEIKEGLKYTKNHLTEIINHFMSHEEDFITKGNESPLVKTLGNEGWILDFE